MKEKVTVEKVKELLKEGMTQSAIADMYGASRQRIYIMLHPGCRSKDRESKEERKGYLLGLSRLALKGEDQEEW